MPNEFEEILQESKDDLAELMPKVDAMFSGGDDGVIFVFAPGTKSVNLGFVEGGNSGGVPSLSPSAKKQVPFSLRPLAEDLLQQSDQQMVLVERDHIEHLESRIDDLLQEKREMKSGEFRIIFIDAGHV